MRTSTALLLACAALIRVCSAAESSLVVATAETPTQWTVSYHGKPILVYASEPHKYKPYVKELWTLSGKNLLRDAPHDHLHHHALMYGITVNGVNFWEETAGSGVQRVLRTSPLKTTATSGGLPRVGLRQEIMWLAAQHAFLPASNAPALLIETRELSVVANEASGEVALEWNSVFQVPASGTNAVLTGANYHGLGMRFAADLDNAAEHFFLEGAPALSGTQQDVSSHPWMALRFRTATPATLALIGLPDRGSPQTTFFSMARPFAYLSATHGLHAAPRIYKPGEKFEVRYLVVVWSDVKEAAKVHDRARLWWQAGF